MKESFHMNLLFYGALLLIFCLPISGATALALGICYTILLGKPCADTNKKLVSAFLGAAIVGLGANMNLITVSKVGIQGLGYTSVSIATTIFLAWALGKALKLDSSLTILLGAGTAICGGSAIVATANTLNSKHEAVSIALGVVFLLNAVALFIFPALGHYFGLNETQFGLWSALAIHDTSSVVGASLQYGAESLAIATTVKLARACFIVPMTLLLGAFYRSAEAKSGQKKALVPWFIAGFLIASGLTTFAPSLAPLGDFLAATAKRVFVVALFLVGSSISLQHIKDVGWRALAHGTFLWFLVATVMLALVRSNFIGI